MDNINWFGLLRGFMEATGWVFWVFMGITIFVILLGVGLEPANSDKRRPF